MKNYLLPYFLLSFSIVSIAQIDDQNVYITKSCAGETVQERIQFSDYRFDKSTFYYKGSNIPDLKAYINGTLLDTITEIAFPEKSNLYIDIEFQITDEVKKPEIYYSVKINKKINRASLPIYLATYSVDNKQNYIQTHNACSEYVYWAFPFYATQTDIYLYDITDDKRNLIKGITYYCCSRGNIIRMPRDTKGKFAVSVSGCYTGDSFTFEVNTMSKH